VRAALAAPDLECSRPEAIGEIDSGDGSIDSLYVLFGMPEIPPTLAGVTLTQLAYAVAVDDHRHFGRAANACRVTQPTLSMQVGKLERALGVVLFDRARAPVVPTDVGRAVVEQARATLREAARLLDVRDAALGVVAGAVRVGVIPTLAPYLLPRVVSDVTRRHPHLELVIEERVTDEVVDGVRRGSLDAGVIASPAGTAEVAEQHLFTEPFVGYVSQGHRLAGRETLQPADLSLDDLWLLSEGHCFRAQAVRLCGQRAVRGARSADACTSGARFESGNLETLKRLVERGVGMTLLPALAAADLPAAQRRLVRTFSDPAPSRDVRLVRRRANTGHRLVDAVVAALLAAVPGEMKGGR
jgi:LysR family transcriptional regulator, hydrogen peroxide-inducible genes activator